MLRVIGVTLGAIVVCVCSAAAGQEWADKMFEVKAHDFGTVARAAKTEFDFVFTNPYVDEIHIASVGTSCGCTTPTVVTPSVKTYGQGAIRATFNTDRFSGKRGATLTVRIDRPYPAEVELRIDGYIRSDVMFTPGSIQLGTVEQGAAAVRKATLNFSGRSGVGALEVRSANPHLHGKLVETGRYYGQASYEMTVELDKDAPAGYVNEQLLVVTNDGQGTQFPLPVEGRVESSLSVSPATLFLGTVQAGQKVTKQVVVRGKRAFHITAVHCDDAAFQANSDPKAAKTLHLVPITFVAGKETGKLTRSIRIETELGTQEVSVSAVVPGTVAAK